MRIPSKPRHGEFKYATAVCQNGGDFERLFHELQGVFTVNKRIASLSTQRWCAN